MGKRFVKKGDIGIQSKRTIGSKVGEAKIIHVDEKKKWAQDRTLGSAGEDRNRMGVNTMDIKL